MSDAYTEALKEAFATAQSDVAVLDTIEIYHPILTYNKPKLQVAVVFENATEMRTTWSNMPSYISSLFTRLLDAYEEVEMALVYYREDDDIVTLTDFGNNTAYQDAHAGATIPTGAYSTTNPWAALAYAVNELSWENGVNTTRFTFLVTESAQQSMTPDPQEAAVVDLHVDNNINFSICGGIAKGAWFPSLAVLPYFFDTDYGPSAIPAVMEEALVGAEEGFNLAAETGISPFYLVKDLQGHTMTLEDDTEVFFEASGFTIETPEKSEEGIQDLTIAIDNTDLRVSDFIKEALKIPNQPIQIKYRPYLSNDFSAPQLDPPLVLYLSEVSIDRFEVTGRASFADILNKKFLTEKYTATRFPGL